MPFEEVIHYPLKSRLEALMRCEAFEFSMGYESWRPQSEDGIVSDVYDCAQWKSTFGSAPPLNDPVIRSIKLLFCYDGIPAHNYPGAKSLIPGEFIILSHPPWLRYKQDNILISFLFPDGLSAKAQKKFFDKIIEDDLEPVFTQGICEGTIQVEIFGHTLDLKGREKFLNQISVQSYVGCSHCRAVFPKGCGGPRFGIARRYLPEDHPLRVRVCLSVYVCVCVRACVHAR